MTCLVCRILGGNYCCVLRIWAFEQSTVGRFSAKLALRWHVWLAGFKQEITAVRSVIEKSTAGRFCAKLASWWHVWFVGFKEETTWRFYILATGEPRPGWSKLGWLVAGYRTWLLERFRGRWPGIRLEAHCSSSPEIRGLLRPENGTEESARGSFMSQPGGNWPSGGWRGWSLCLPRGFLGTLRS